MKGRELQALIQKFSALPESEVILLAKFELLSRAIKQFRAMQDME